MNELALEYLRESDADAVAIGILDFKNHSHSSHVFSLDNLQDDIYFDLASLTKVLTNGQMFFKHSEAISKKLRLLGEHRASLPAWGRLPRSTWRQQILSYKIEAADTLYSDLSALRFMLEFEKETKLNFKDECKESFDPQVLHWTELDSSMRCLQNGFDGKKKNFSLVHDPNARHLGGFLSHAGLFATIDGLGRTLLEFDSKYQLLAGMNNQNYSSRFVSGWDTKTEHSTAGEHASSKTFGHLGFTGTSIWIDPELRLGLSILTNTTKFFWFNRTGLNELRRQLGDLLWQKRSPRIEDYFI